jgi:hypothetical protein
MKKGLPNLLLIVSLLFAHLFLFPKPVSPRLGIKPLFFTEASRERRSELTGDGTYTGAGFVYPFVSETKSGFFLRDGRILSSLPKDEVLTISSLGYVARLGEGADKAQGFFDPNQVLRGLLPSEGLPYLTDHGLYHFSPDRRRVKEFASDGAELWSHGFNTIVSVFADSDEYRLLGTAQGEGLLFDKDGAVLHRFEPPSEGIKAIYGLAIDESERRIAILHGVTPQKLSLYEKGNKNWHISSEWELPGHLFRETALAFHHGGKVLRIERNAYLLTIDILSRNMTRCDIPGFYLGGGTLPSLSISYGVNESEKEAVMLLDEYGEILFSLDMKEKPWFFNQDGKTIFIAFDQVIGGMEIERY